MKEDRKRCLEAGVDAQKIQRGAHTLKDSADIFGACSVVTAASQLEEIGHLNELARAVDVLSETPREFDIL